VSITSSPQTETKDKRFPKHNIFTGSGLTINRLQNEKPYFSATVAAATKFTSVAPNIDGKLNLIAK
jgi:hypothetical protein